jgi:glutamate/tyrosine decarboxylase-like PLP-dependent enzyme
MDITQRLLNQLNRLPPPLWRLSERLLKRIPPTRRLLERQLDKLGAEVGDAFHPYRGQVASYTHLPRAGLPRAAILEEMNVLAQREQNRWQEGYASGAVYHGDQAHIDFVNQVYALHSQVNPLHADLWPSAVKYEAEIVEMTANMLGKSASGAPVCGTVTSGGTESILLAMKSYRDWASSVRRPEVVLPTTAHVAFDKAAHYFGLKLVKIPVGADSQPDPAAFARAITRRTIALVGSAPSFPHGVIDPLRDLSALAQEHEIGLHVDACLGGFVLPWAEKLGYPVPAFDFRLPGVTSMSVDTHKYGYAPKGTSVALYRSPELRRCQYFTAANWPGGLYLSPTLAGSRPGALSAACWATLTSMGETGYLQAAASILAAAGYIRRWIDLTPDLRVIGDPLWVIGFTSDTLDIYRVLDAMSQAGWSLNGLHRPPAIHLATTLRHTQPGVAQRFVQDLQAAVAHVRAQPKARGGMAPLYGMAGSLPMRGLVDDLLRRVLDEIGRAG